MAGHLGQAATLNRPMTWFFWPVIHENVRRWCAACRECQLVNPLASPKALLHPLLLVQVPFERIGMELIGPLERSARRHRFASLAHVRDGIISRSIWAIGKLKWVQSRAVRLIEIEIKSWFELARFLNHFIAQFFPCPRPQPPALCYPNQLECSAPKLSARTEQTGHTDR